MSLSVTDFEPRIHKYHDGIITPSNSDSESEIEKIEKDEKHGASCVSSVDGIVIEIQCATLIDRYSPSSQNDYLGVHQGR